MKKRYFPVCVRPWIKAADVCPLTSTGPCLLHLWQAATARPLKCSLTSFSSSSSSTIISSVLVKAPPTPHPPASPNPARPPLVSYPTVAVCWSSMPSHSNSSVIYVGHPSLYAAGDTNHSVVFNDSAWPCLWISGRRRDAKTRNIYCLFVPRSLIRGRACSVRSRHVHNQKLLPSGRLLHFHIQSL